jgi:hypothetical protein
MKILSTPVLRLCGLLLGLVLAAAAFSPPAVAATTINLSANVTNTDGVPQTGTVCLERVGTGSCGGDDLDNGFWSTTWDSASEVAGDYLIQVTSDTMDGTSRWYAAGNSAGTTDKNLATAVHLADGEADLHFTMVMPAIAKVRGKVVDANGQGIAGRPVLVNESGMIRSVDSGTGGTFDLGYTRAGSWTLYVNGGTSYVTTQTPLVVPASGSVVVPNIVLQDAAVVSGQVTDSVTGDPIPFVDVAAYTTGGSPTEITSVKTDGSGRYVLGGMGGGPILLRFKDTAYQAYTAVLNDGGDPSDWDPQTPIALAAGQHLVHDQQLDPVPSSPLPAHTLSGTVSDTLGHPLANISVFAKQGATAFGTETDRHGRWSLDVADGEYTLAFSQGWRWSGAFGSEAGWAPETYPGRLVSTDPTPVTVSGGVAVDGLDVMVGRDLENLAAPAVSGAATPGRTVTAALGTWSVRTGTTFTTTWFRDGVEIGTGSTYAVRLTDIGHALSVRVVATNGLTTAEAQSGSRVVGRVPTATAARATSPRHRTVKLVVTVTAPGLTPGGSVTVRRGGKAVKGAVALVRGRVVVVLRKQPTGPKRYTVLYGGSAQALPSSKTVKVRVR